MEDHVRGTLEGFHRAFNKLLAGLAKYLDMHIIWDAIFIDDPTYKVEIRL